MTKKIVPTILLALSLIMFSSQAQAWGGTNGANATMTHHNMYHGEMANNGTMMHRSMHQNKMSTNATMARHIRANFRFGLGPQYYPPFEVDISNDLFVNPSKYAQFTGGMPFVDENGDGICDIVQDTEMFRNLRIGPCIDKNEDSICDCFETREAYMRMGMKNFVDVDGDGICDNYEMNPLSNGTGN